MRRALVVLWLIAAGCRSRPAIDPDVERAAAELRAAAGDPVAASTAVTRLARRGCKGREQALSALSRGQISGRLLAALVDDALAASESCAGAAARAAADRAGGAVAALARAGLEADQPERALAALPGDAGEPAVQLRRAELFTALGRHAEALAALERFSAAVPSDLAARAARAEALVSLGRPLEAVGAAGPPPHLDPQLRQAAVAALAAAGRTREAVAAIAAAPVPERSELARRAAELVPGGGLGRLASEPGAGADLLHDLADRLERERGPAGALPLRRRAAALEPGRADLADALAGGLAATGAVDEAVAAWDRAASLAPAQPTYVLSPIRALAGAGQVPAARRRARALAAAARAGGDVDRLLTASSAAAAAGEVASSVELARDALRARPGDGRLVFILGEKLEGAGDAAAAAAVWSELLVCGARGRPWHRHEVAGRLVGLARDAASTRAVRAALDARRSCAAVDPDEVAELVALMREKLPADAPPAPPTSRGGRTRPAPRP